MAVNSWRTTTLGEIIQLKRGYDLPKKNRCAGPFPVVSSSGVGGCHDEAKVKGPGVVTGRYGTIGEVYYITSDFWPLNTSLYVRDFKGNCPRFISYFLRTLNFQAYSDKAAVPGLNRNDLHTAIVRVPGVYEQREIASILGALDDKIELNRRMNETLEAIARATFKSWLVDFDPVRAKADGRQLAGMDAETEALFPDSFEETSIGKIPRGWVPTLVGDVVDIIRGRSYRSSELSDSPTALVTLKSFYRGGGYRADGLKPYTGKFKPEQEIAPGELIVACTDVTQAAEVVGKPAIVRADDRFETLVASLDLSIVRPKTSSIGTPYLYCLFLTDDFQAHGYSYATGTTVLHLGKQAIPSYLFPKPTDALLDRFCSMAESKFKKIQLNEQQSRVLAETRDALLPKLLSGEIRVKDAERFVEEHAG